MADILKEGAEKLGIALTQDRLGQLETYKKVLLEWNEKMNLTAITDDFGVYTKHFLDSLTPILTEKVSGRVIDVGTGAGFPGLVLKIACPEIELTLLDSLNKRINFLKEAAEKIGIPGIEFVHARAEDGARREREKYDTAVARAVANMSVLSELCLPFVRVGGYFLALKGPMAKEELNDARRAITVLGGKLEEVFPVEIPFTELSHKIIIVKKVRHTPMQYPRKAGIPSKTPIKTCYNLKKSAIK